MEDQTNLNTSKVQLKIQLSKEKVKLDTLDLMK